jgi:hypothetical protein
MRLNYLCPVVLTLSTLVLCLRMVCLRDATRIESVHDIISMNSRNRSEERNKRRLEKAKRRGVQVKIDARNNANKVSDGESCSDKIVKDDVGLAS